MVKILAWLIRPIIEETLRQIHLRRRKEAFKAGIEGLEAYVYMGFGDFDALSDGETELQGELAEVRRRANAPQHLIAEPSEPQSLPKEAALLH